LEEQTFPAIFGREMGEVYYLILFTGGIYAASITEYFRQRNNQSYSSLGASGAISSILFAWMVLEPQGELSVFMLPQMRGWIIGLILLAVSLFLIRRKKTSDYNDNISHESHFWGAIFGLVFILIVKPSKYVEFYHEIINW
jgi:membrane associated rhomboid family serine protease